MNTFKRYLIIAISYLTMNTCVNLGVGKRKQTYVVGYNHTVYRIR